jgi:Na+:H+ antiporter, NhaA family
MPERPGPVRRLGDPPVPDEPHATVRRPEPDAVVDEDVDVFGAERAAARLAAAIEEVPAGTVRTGPDGRQLLTPPFAADRDRVDGPLTAPVTLVVFGAHATPASRPLGALFADVRRRHAATVAIAWRHYPDPAAHRRACMFALAAEAAGAAGRFWALTHQLLALRHHNPEDLDAAVVRASLDPLTTLDAMRAGTGTDRIVDDVASARSSGVIATPALFIDGVRYDGELEARAVMAALDAAVAST